MPIRMRTTGIYREYPDRASFDVTTAFSMSIFYKYHADPGGATSSFLVSRYNGAATSGTYGMGTQSTDAGAVGTFIATSVGTNITGTGALPVVGIWGHLTFTWQSGTTTMSIYKDGHLLDTSARSGTMGALALAIRLAEAVAGTNHADTSLAYFGFWNVELTAEEAAMLADGVPPWLIRGESQVLCDELTAASIELVGMIKGTDVGDVLGTPQDLPPTIRRRIRMSEGPLFAVNPWFYPQALRGIKPVNTRNLTANLKANVQETRDLTTNLKALVKATVDVTANLVSRVQCTQHFLDPALDISNFWTRTGGDGVSAYSCINQAIRSPNNAASLSPAEYLQGSGVDTTSWRCDATPYPFALPTGEAVTSVRVWAYIDPLGAGSLTITLRVNVTIVATITYPSPVTAGWYYLDWAFTSSPSAADMNDLRPTLQAVGGPLRCHGAYIEATTCPIRDLTTNLKATVIAAQDITANLKANVQETFDKTTNLKGTVSETFDKTTNLKASVQETKDVTANLKATVLVVDNDKTTNLKANVQETFDKVTNLKATVFDTSDVQTFLTAYVSRWSTLGFKRTCPHFRVLVEIDWPENARRYADESVVIGTTGYDGRIIEISTIKIGSNGRKDAVTVTLDNLPRLATIESLWTDELPPEGAAARVYLWFTDDGESGKVPLFEGIVDEIQDIDEEKVVISLLSEAEYDEVMIGKAITSVAWPDAPPASEGKIEPLVFGEILEFEAIPVTEVGKSGLAGTALAADTTVFLEDVSRFASSGSILIGDEEVTYGGRDTALNTLTTVAARLKDYPAGTEVREKTILTFLLAQHALDSIGAVKGVVGERVKVLDSGLYTSDLTGPSTVSFADGWPLIDVPAGGSDFIQIQFDAAGTGDTATNSVNACADATGWTEKNYATVAGSGNKLVVNQSTDVAALGDIVKAWVMVEYDGPRSIANGPGLELPRYDIKVAGSSVGTLARVGNLPTEIKNRAGALGITRAYNDDHEALDPGHAHSSGANVTYTQFLDDAVQTNWNEPANMVGTNFVNFSTANAFATLTSAGLVAIPEAASRGTLVSYQFHADCDPIGGNLVLQEVCSGVNGVIKTWTGGSGRATQNFTVKSSGVTWADLYMAASTFIKGNTITAGNLIYAIWMTVIYTPNSTDTDPALVTQTSDEPLTHTVAQLAEITSTVGGDWAWFENRDITVEHISGAVTNVLRVVRVSFLIEYAQTRRTPVDRLLVDVVGLAPTGKATDILIEIMTHPMLLDKDADSYGAGDFTLAQARLDVMGAAREDLDPNSTSVNDIPLTGAATLHAALDSDQASYAGVSGTSTTTRTGTCGLPTYVKAAPVAFVEFACAIRWSGQGTVMCELLSGATAVASISTPSQAEGQIVTVVASWISGDISQATIDGLEVRITMRATPVGILTGTARVYSARVRVYHYGEPHVLGFAITEPTRAQDLIGLVARNSRLRYWYEEAALKVVFLEDPDDIEAGDEIVRVSDMPEGSFVTRRRSAFRDIVSILTVRYRYDYRESRLAGSTTVEAPILMGRHFPADRELSLLRDGASALAVAIGMLLRERIARYVSMVPTRLPFLDLRIGSAVQVDANRIQWEKAEIDAIEIDVREAEVRLTVVVYDPLA